MSCSESLNSPNWAGWLQVKKLTTDLEAALTAMTKTQKDIQASLGRLVCWLTFWLAPSTIRKGLGKGSMGARGAWTAAACNLFGAAKLPCTVVIQGQQSGNAAHFVQHQADPH